MPKQKSDTNPKHNKKRHGTTAYFDTEKQRIKRSKIKSIDGFEKIGEKTDGVSAGGIYSKIVIGADGKPQTRRYMLKAMDPYSMASEYIGANMARLYIGDSAPIVELVRGKNGELFVASEFIENFETLKALSERLNLPQECFPYGCVVDQDGKLQPVAPYLQSALQQEKTNNPQVKDAELINIVADYLQHDDAHDRNVGVRRDPAGLDMYTTSLIDYSWSLREARSGSAITYNPNYASNYDSAKVIGAIDTVLSIPPQEMAKATKPLFQNLAEFYGEENAVFKEAIPPSNYLLHMADLAQQGIQKFFGVDWSSKKTLNDVQSSMIESLEERADVLRNERERIIQQSDVGLPLSGYGNNSSTFKPGINETSGYIGNSSTPLIDSKTPLRLIGGGAFIPPSSPPSVAEAAIAAAVIIPVLKKIFRPSKSEESSKKHKIDQPKAR